MLRPIERSLADAPPVTRSAGRATVPIGRFGPERGGRDRARAKLSAVEWALIGVAGLKVAVGVVALALGFAPATALTSGFVILQLAAYGGAGVVLIVAHARDDRTAYLGAVLLLVASSFAGATVVALARQVPIFGWLVPIYPDACLPVFLARFIAVFPRRPQQSWQARTLRAIATGALTLGLGLLLLNALAGWRLVPASGWVYLFLRRSAGGTVYWTVVFVPILGSLLVALNSARALAAEEQRRVRWFWISFCIGFGPAVIAIVSGALPGVGVYVTAWILRQWPWRGIELLLATVPFTVGYAVMVRRMLPLRVVIRQAAQYVLARWTISTALIAPVVYALVEGYRHRHETIEQVFSTRTTPLLVMMLVAGVIFALRDPILRLIDRWFFREAYDPEQILIGFRAQARRARGIDELVAIVTSAVDRALRPETLAMLVRNPSGDFVSVFGAVEPLAARTMVAELLAETPDPVEVDLDSLGPLRWLPLAERQWLVDSRSRLLVPLHASDGDLVGIVTVAERKSELPFSRKDHALLRAIADLGAATLEVHSPRRHVTPEGPVDDEWAVGPATRFAGGSECAVCGHVETAGDRPCARCSAPLRASGVPHVMFGKFRFEERVGQGGMGVVYRATDLALDRPVAIKTLPGTSPEDSQRLRAEAKVMAAVVHRHLAMIYGAESWRGRPMLICEFMTDGTLADRLRRAPLAAADMLAIGVALAEGLAVIHSKGLLHRDIKPSNIGFGADGVPKLLDFGLVHFLTHNPSALREAAWPPNGDPLSMTTLSMSQSLIGTPLYLSPEAIAGDRPSIAFDLWSLNVLLLEATAGRHPFRGSTLAETFDQIQAASLPDAARFEVTPPTRVMAYFERALARDPRVRPQTALEVAGHLSALVPYV